MAKIVKILGSFKKTRQPIPESELIIEVEYDPQENEVTGIESVIAKNMTTGAIVDLTAILYEQMDLDAYIDKVDWAEVYADQLETV